MIGLMTESLNKGLGGAVAEAKKLDIKGKGKRGRSRFKYVGHIYTSGEWVGIEVEVF